MIQTHLTSQPLSKRLEELGVPQESEFYWSKNASYGWQIADCKVPKEDGEENGMTDGVSAFLSSELGEMLPQFILVEGLYLELHLIRSSVWRLYYGPPNLAFPKGVKFTAKTGDSLAESMGLMLEYLITNGLIKL